MPKRAELIHVARDGMVLRRFDCHSLGGYQHLRQFQFLVIDKAQSLQGAPLPLSIRERRISVWSTRSAPAWTRVRTRART